MTRTLMLVLCAGLLGACDPEASIGPRIGEAVQAQENALIAAVTAEDAAAAAAFYAPDAQVFNAGGPPQTTPEAVRAGFEHVFADPNGSLTFATENVILPSSPDYAITEGSFTVTYTDPAAPNQVANLTGHYITLWRHQDDDSWKIIRDISTPSAAAAPAPAAP